MGQTVEAVCAKTIKLPGMAAGCNIFVQTVAGAFGKSNAVEGNADAIRSSLSRSPFKNIGMNPAMATQFATQGKLVIGGLSRAEMTYTDKAGHSHHASMGHVVVVVPGGPSKAIEITLTNGKTQQCRGGYPYCYQGAAVAAYRFLGRTQVDAVFPSSLLDEVFYAYLDI